MIYKHVLKGCSPTPLAHYLKALGLLRLVSEQKDSTCRGAWIDDHFVLATTLNREELKRFFLEEYEPTAMLAPWNGASGFYRTWDEKGKKLRNSKNGEALVSLVKRSGSRWNQWKIGYDNAIQLVAPIAKKVDISRLPTKERKALLVLPLGNCGSIYLVIDKGEGKESIQKMMTWANSMNPFYSSAMTAMEDGNTRLSGVRVAMMGQSTTQQDIWKILLRAIY